MLTTECNAEPFIRGFDGYLTWHWQFQDQVPAFPAIYGGSIQMFGRAYRGGPTQDLALRMKAGQQLVFGEQIGWIGPEIVDRPDSAAFLKKIAALRWQFSRYFDQGVMERPPHLRGDVPPVTADWQWSGEWPITTPAIQTGAWRIPKADTLVLFFVNVSRDPVKANLELDLHAYGLSGGSFTINPSSGNSFDTGAMLQKEITFNPDTPLAWEIRSSGNQADDGAQ
jgi:hypothetical protein